jgi:Uma2 family endonuclease
MSIVPEIKLMTTEEMLALPDDGTERWLIRGQLREKPMTVRNRWHSRVLARFAQLIGNWLDAQSEPRGEILVGEVGCRLLRDPDLTFGIDLIYVGPELAAHQPPKTRLIEGIPILAVEILSPSDKVEEIDEKVDEYLNAGVLVVWIVDPHYQTVTVYRSDAQPVLFNADQELNGEPHLPGFSVHVCDIFKR